MPTLTKRPIKEAKTESVEAVAVILELLSRNFARLAVKLRHAADVTQRDEYQSFVETVAVLHDQRALDDLAAADVDDEVHDWEDVREELGLGSRRPQEPR